MHKQVKSTRFSTVGAGLWAFAAYKSSALKGNIESLAEHRESAWFCYTTTGGELCEDSKSW